MPQLNFTEKSIRRLPAPGPGKQVLYWDTALKNFGLLCSGDTRTFVCRGSVNGHDIRKKVERADLISLNDARLRAKEMMLNFSGGIDPRVVRTSNVTLREALGTYLNLRQDLKSRTRDEYRAVVERHLSSWLDKPLRLITRDMVEKRHREIAEDVEQKNRTATAEAAKRHLRRAERNDGVYQEAADRHRAKYQAASVRKAYSGYATANGAMRALRAIWNFMADRVGDLPPNPVKLRRQWHPVKPRERILRADDLPAFYQAVRALPNQIAADYICLMLFTGLRRREASSLKWKDVDFSGRIIRIAMTKSGRKLDLPMADVIHDLLVARRSLGETNYVFPSPSASGFIQSPKFYFAQIADATGIRVSPHDLRRTFITIAESCDISPFALRALVNHSLGKDVTSSYIQMTAERLREPVQRVANKIKELLHAEEPHGANAARLK
jgi:integrase